MPSKVWDIFPDAPIIRASVGKMSEVFALPNIFLGRLITFGHSIILGTRTPPSYKDPFLPRNFPEFPTLGKDPLSLQYQTKVFSRILFDSSVCLS